MQELGLRGNKIKMLQDVGYTFEEAYIYVQTEDVEMQGRESLMEFLPHEVAFSFQKEAEY